MLVRWSCSPTVSRARILRRSFSSWKVRRRVLQEEPDWKWQYGDGSGNAIQKALME